MKLHGLTVRNWRNIGELQLSGLQHPLVVLYGPNRTGKSSLVAALRACLFDEDHNSQKKALLASVPWGRKESPEVAVEFETTGTLYRLTKRFSKGRDGHALLERDGGGGRWIAVERNKEAAAEARRLLGVTNSQSGLNQLLWLEQGTIHLPSAGSLDVSLQQRMQDVLGSLLTGRDWAFARLLDEAWEQYFTRTGQEKKNSPVMLLQEQFTEREEAVRQQHHRELNSLRLLRDFEDLTQEILEAERHAAEAWRELERIEAEQQSGRERRASHQAARTEHEHARQRLDEAERLLAARRDAETRISQARAALADTEAALQREETLREAARAATRTAQAALADAQRQVEDCEAQRRGWDDQRRLGELTREAERLHQNLAEHDCSAAQIAEQDATLATLLAPGEEELKAIRKDRREAEKLRAELDAAATQLVLIPDGDQTLSLQLDGGSPQSIPLAAGEEHALAVRRIAELRIPSFGVLRIHRGGGDRSVEQSLRQLADLDQSVAQRLALYGVDASVSEPLDLLEERRHRQRQLARDREEAARRAHELAPRGRGALAAELARCEHELQSIRERTPVADAASVGTETELFAPTRPAATATDWEQQLKVLKAALRKSTETATEAARRERDADEQWQQSREQAIHARATEEYSATALARFASREELERAYHTARDAADAAAQRVQATTLSDDERSVDDRLQRERLVLERREEHLERKKTERHRVEWELGQMAGLHESLATAEAELTDVRGRLQDARIDADAHRLLKQLFDDCRQRQVQQTTGLVGRQVLEAARRLGLDEYSDVDFGAGYLPEKLRRRDVDELVPLGSESLGTSEQLALLIRLAVGGLLANGEPQLAVLDDPLTHADARKHRRMLELLEAATRGGADSLAGERGGPLQIVILTCHRERFDHLASARLVDLAAAIRRSD